MKELVISGINLFEGGPLSIYYDCLDCIIENEIYKDWKITAFVHSNSLFTKYSKCVDLIELPKSRKNYAYRLYYEYHYFEEWSKGKDIDVWLSLHDITPNVHAKKIYTYCHNPSPFLKVSVNSFKYNPTYAAFGLFYKYLYGINIKKAAAIIVQQDWMRQAFLKMYPVKNVIVARPSINIQYKFNKDNYKKHERKFFIFASYPRFFKNFEVICEASKLIQDQKYEIWLTLDGTENSYSRDLKKKYGDDPHIKWLGLQPREDIFKLYDQADYMIFPSKLETWGLPISEFKMTGKGEILADLPYAHETIGTYDKVAFFDPNNAYELSDKVRQLLAGRTTLSATKENSVKNPFTRNWNELLRMILDDNDLKQ